MSELTHAQASEMLLWVNLTPTESRALREHLSRCATCRHNAAVHAYLARDLPRAMPISANAAAFRTRFLHKVNWVESRKQWAGPIYTLATTAVLALLLTVGWLFWSMQLGQGETVVVNSDPIATGDRPVAAITPAIASTADTTPDVRGSVIVASVPAPSLQGARLPQDVEQTVAIYLPPSYHQSDRRYPVVFWLAYSDGPQQGQFNIGEVQKVMDGLLSAEAIQEMIVVVPPVRDSYDHRVIYHNSPVTGNWVDFLLGDVVGYVDANLRTIAQPSARGLGGAALTATNALDIAMTNPGVFDALYLKHPLLFAPGAMDDSFLMAPQSVRNVLALLSELDALAPQMAHERYVALLREHNMRLEDTLALDYGMAYAPKPEAQAPYFDYLYQAAGTPADDDIWARWEEGFGNLPQKVRRHAGALRRLNGLYIEYSPHSLSFPWSNDGAPYLARQLEQHDIPFTLETYVGSAVLDTMSRMEQVMFPFFSETLVAP